MSNLGIGVLLKMCGCNEKNVNSYIKAIGKTIKDIFKENNALTIKFDDGKKLLISDGGQSSCEERYMTIDDDLSGYDGAILNKIELRDVQESEENYEVHETQFVVVTTSKGSFTVCTHNVHNGYYGGFYLELNFIG